MSKGTILDYLEEYGQLSFGELPFHDVDSLILSQFAYLKFDGIVPYLSDRQNAISLIQMKKNEKFDDLFADERYRKENRALFEAMLASKRFAHMECFDYVNIIEEDKETQFSAVTYALGDDIVYVAFRGTDETLVGWKEDFNMFLEESVPGQRMSIDYLEQAVEKAGCPVYVGGHSKGGNLAVYASIFCAKGVQEKIRAIYDHDGPGMRPENKKRAEYARIKPLIHKSVPHSSVVGLFLSFDDDRKVIASKYLGVMQHDPYSWLVEQGEFVEYKDIKKSNIRRGEIINEWAADLSDAERHLLVDTLYQVTLASGEKDLISLKKNWKTCRRNMNSAMKDVDADTRRKLLNILKQLIDYALPDLPDFLEKRIDFSEDR